MDIPASLSPILIEVLYRFPRIILVLALAYVASFLLRRLVPRFIRAALRRERDAVATEELAKRQQTLESVIEGALGFLLLVIVGLTLLAEMQVDIAPALASLGVVGIAVGFGAQSLVRDIFSGMFILLEDQYRKGDVVTIASINGLVEEVNLRRTILRDLDGVVHSIPNGEVKVASNRTKQWSRINLDLSVTYDTDIDKAREIIDRLGLELADDPEFGPLITEPPKFVRVDAFHDNGITLKILGVTKPVSQWEVAGEFRYRVLKAFTEAGLAITPPHRTAMTKAAAQPTETIAGDTRR